MRFEIIIEEEVAQSQIISMVYFDIALAAAFNI